MTQITDPTIAYDFLILPGRGNSGVDHWHSSWSMAFPSSARVLQDDWDAPKLTDWLPRLDQAVAQGSRPAVLIGHSLGVSLAVHWLTSRPPGRVKAAFLVAPSDVESPAHTPELIRNFAPLPRKALSVPAVVVASTNDTFVSIERAQQFATDWGADFCNIGELVHINSTSRLGLRPQGRLLFGRLIGRIKA